MGFQPYKGTVAEPWILPIIPVGARLSENSKIPPENIGKIPGQFYPHAGVWSGFAGWSKQATNGGRVFHIWDIWYPKDEQTIGLQTGRFPSIDADVNEAWQADIVRQVSYKVFGQTIVRGRGANSPRQLLMYRLVEGDFIPKYRRVYAGPGVPEFAVEILGKGQQCLIEGLHPKGGRYEWTANGEGEGVASMLQLPDFGFEKLPRIGPGQIPQFVAELDAEFALLGVVPQRPRQLRSGDSGGGPGATAIGPEHPQVAPSIAELNNLLGFITVNDRALEDYDTWEQCCRAIKCACGGDEAFYDEVYIPWMMENPKNDPDVLRAKWESHGDSKIGYDWLCALAAPHGYVPSTEGLFEPLGDGDAAVDDPGSSVGPAGGDSVQVVRDPSTPGVPATAQPQGARPKADHERVIADRFVAKHARKRWIWVPMSNTSGQWLQFKDGVWMPGRSISYAVGADCYDVSQAIRTSNATPAELGRAQYLSSAAAQNNVLQIVKSHPKIIVERSELDNNDWLMGVPGGYIDKFGQLMDPDPTKLITKRTGVKPDASVPCPRFDDLLFRLSNYDMQTMLAMRSALGYTLSGTGSIQVFFFLFGHHAHEGKTTFLSLLGKVLGDYTHVLPPQAFVAGRGGQDNRFAFGGIEGKWFVYRGEVEDSEEWATSALKDHTGSGYVSVEQKGKDSITVKTRGGFWFQGNHLPRFRKPDPGLRRRMVIFDCKVGVGEQQSADWANDVFEQEGPGILASLLQMREDYRLAKTLYIAPAMIEERNEYLNTQDAIRQFIEQSVVFDPEASVSSHDLYNQWRMWRDGEGLDQRFGGSLATFIKAFIKHELCEPHNVQSKKLGSDGARYQAVGGCRIGAPGGGEE